MTDRKAAVVSQHYTTLFRCSEWISKSESAQLLEEHCILIETISGFQETVNHRFNATVLFRM